MRCPRYTLCTIPDPARALAEVHRILKPGGTFHFVEHGLAPDDDVVKKQREIEPINRRLAGGCHLDPRPLGAARRTPGSCSTGSTAVYGNGPKPYAFHYLGTRTA